MSPGVGIIWEQKETFWVFLGEDEHFREHTLCAKPELQKIRREEKGKEPAIYPELVCMVRGGGRPPPPALSDCLVGYQPVPGLRSACAERPSEARQPVGWAGGDCIRLKAAWRLSHSCRATSQCLQVSQERSRNWLRFSGAWMLCDSEVAKDWLQGSRVS